MEDPSNSNVLTIAVSTRALFDLEAEHEIAQQDLTRFHQHQQQNESLILRPGAAFPLVKALSGLRDKNGKKLVRIILVSKNHPTSVIRVENSARHYGIEFEQTVNTGGHDVIPYVEAYHPDLFLSADQADAHEACARGIPAAQVGALPESTDLAPNELVIAFDGDCVIFSEESELICQQEGLQKFFEHEAANLDTPLPEGPLAPLFKKLSVLKTSIAGSSNIKLALVTARSGPARSRAFKTVRSMQGELDFAACTGPAPKLPILQKLKPIIFFDDDRKHCDAAKDCVPTGHVPFGPKNAKRATATDSKAEAAPAALQPTTHTAQKPPVNLRLTLRGYLGSREAIKELASMCESRTADWPEQNRLDLLEELATSIELQPVGADRRARSGRNTKKEKLRHFLHDLIRKHQPK